jgi:serine phosphatase RsbU (regulator of sigma subunit)
MMSLLVLLTLAGNSWQFARTFITFQKDQVENTIQMQAESAGGRIESEIERWKAQIATALPSFQGGVDNKEIETAIRRFLAANEELVSLSIFGAPSRNSTKFKLLGQAFTPLTNAQRFEDKVPTRVWTKLQGLSRKFLKRQAQRLKKHNIGIDSIAKSTDLPLMMMAARFDVSESKAVIWAVLTTWQSNIIKAIPSSPDMQIVLVDSNGKTVSSQTLPDMLKRKRFEGEPLVKAALKGTSPSGFEDEYKVHGKRRLGAFFRLPQYDVAVLVQKDAERAYTAMRKNLLSTLLWASFFILFSVMFAYVGARGITKSLRDVTYATSRIASGDFEYRIQPRTSDEVAQLGLAVNAMSTKIVELLSTQIEKARFEKELETAKMVQQTFFPKVDIKTTNLTAYGFYTPASECGGDLWGHFPIDDGVDFLFIADAMGHGAPAALVTAMAYSTTMTIADIVKDRTAHEDSPAKILDRLNRIIYEAVRGQISMTFFASVIDTRTGTLTYANAGHNFPLLVPADRLDDRIGKKSKKREDVLPLSLKLMGTPLGMDPKSIYKEQSIALRPGDKLFYFTDGLIECTSPDGRVWGRKYLVESIAEAWDRSGEDMKDEIIGKAFQFFGNKPLADDVTVVVAELGRSWTAQAMPEPAAAAPRMTAPPATAAFTQQAVTPVQDLDVLMVAAAPPQAAPARTAAPETVAPRAAAPERAPHPPKASQPPTHLAADVPPPSRPAASMPPASIPPQSGAPKPTSPSGPRTGGKFKIKLPSTG